jgi:hypothetical protein
MGIEVVIEFLASATVRIITYVYTDDDELTDPTTSIKVTIYDPNGDKQVDGDDMTQSDTGIYEYYYQTTSSTDKGWWHGNVVVVDGTGDEAKTSVGSFSFKVK